MQMRNGTCWVAAVLTAWCAAAGAAERVQVHIRADQVRCRVNEMTCGVNMEDLHYQMTGGFSSQLIHGESFFEPSRAAHQRLYGKIEAFMNVGGEYRVEAGVLHVSLSAESLPEHGRKTRWSPGFEPRARLQTRRPVLAGDGAVGVDLWLNEGATKTVSLLLALAEPWADNRPEWFAGYKVELNPARGRVVLGRIEHPRRARTVTEAPCDLPAGRWVRVAAQRDAGRIVVTIDGKERIAWQDPVPLEGGHVGLLTYEPVRVRDLGVRDAGGEPRRMPFEMADLPDPDEQISMRWAKVRLGTARGRFRLLEPGNGTWFDTSASQSIEFVEGEGEIGIDNAGLERWGIAIHQGRPYEGYLRTRAERPTDLVVSLRSADGARIYAEQTIRAEPGDGGYQRCRFDLTPNASDPDGRFAVTLRRPGRVVIGYAFLQPGPWGLFKGLPFRKDLVEALIAQGAKLVRLNGGMIERPGYRWKHMQKPRDQRPPYDGLYDRYGSLGYGVIEHLALCRAAGFTPVIALNDEEEPHAFADLVAFCNQPADTDAGRRRALLGYAEPFGLKYLQVGNESAMNARYVNVFKRVAEAVWQVDPDVALLPVGKGYRGMDTLNEAEARRRLAPHLELTRFAHERGKTLFWDAHAFNTSHDPGQPLDANGQTRGAVAFSRWLTRLEPALGPVPVGILECNAAAFDFKRGLQHACEVNVIHRNGDVVLAAAMPNVSQPWGVYQNDWKAALWTQGNIYYTQEKVWYQPAALVDRMVTRHWAPHVVACDVEAQPKTLDVTAARTDDGKLVLRAVNVTDRPVAAAIAVEGFTPRSPTATVEVMSGPLHATNTLEQPRRIAPRTLREPHGMSGGTMTRTFEPYSFTVIQLQ